MNAQSSVMTEKKNGNPYILITLCGADNKDRSVVLLIKSG